MKLAIICAMPVKRIVSGDLKTVERIAEGLSPRLDNICLEEEVDLSEHAEQSALDAFSYCHGPFESMVFVRAKDGDVAVSPDIAAAVDWVLFLRHDCIVDIQAFEHLPDDMNDFDTLAFQKWDTSGPRSKLSHFRFGNLGSSDGGTHNLPNRILIEPFD